MVRKTTANDLEQIFTLEQSCFKECYPYLFWKKAVQNSNYLCLVFETKGKVMGYVICQSTDVYDLLRLCVAPNSRKTGIGKQLIERLDDKPVVLEVAKDNFAAISFYESCGFVTQSIRRDYYGPNKDAVSYIKAKI